MILIEQIGIKFFRHYSRQIRNQAGFSFIELMVVVIILGILAGAIVPRYMDKADKAKVVKAQVDIAAIETSLKMYKLDNGFYPTTEQGLWALIEKPNTDPVPRSWNENGYFEKQRVPKDPWGNEYVYLCPGVHGTFDLMSYGADSESGGEGINADVTNWEVQE
ncbi:MAG: type II secretion system major pseudopilin GspG [Desulfobacter sp.]|jgi:general secretion pathway protein G|uniref:type II secretion system major pseudopilin GspG n=1 Tax=uncultured Desulfobacter sp. TaxID=240139 RepID=UPI0029C67412|nr:type II secretion system major pseudopilin GspG [uncultured Desulfobacter sp.]MCW8799317.1 type II secretion system major pseudopilin GspG [Desulfobacter sp.]